MLRDLTSSSSSGPSGVLPTRTRSPPKILLPSHLRIQPQAELQPRLRSRPRALTLSEIDEYVALYAQAARNAITAGFDGVEIHGATGYLVDQFLQDVSNVRDDEYGGSIENRSRFALRVPMELIPRHGNVGPRPQFTHLISTLARTHTDLAYIHLVESRAEIGDDASATHKSNAALRAAWAPRRVITAGGYDRAGALAAAEEDGDALVAFGRNYISNPDLPKRLRKDIPLTPYDRKTFYVPVDQPGSAHGYVDYPFAEEGRL
ncbi:hypothetical protein BD779DRAFT_1681538 [Infundibulicybe gibba]|nr:hypothetical protein BD779DRAFT_1681538 [Infundibulicybe gibba]